MEVNLKKTCNFIIIDIDKKLAWKKTKENYGKRKTYTQVKKKTKKYHKRIQSYNLISAWIEKRKE